MSKLEKTNEGYYQGLESWHSLNSTDVQLHRAEGVYFCMFPVCPLCCFIVISMDPVSEINDDDDDSMPSPSRGIFFLSISLDAP